MVTPARKVCNPVALGFGALVGLALGGGAIAACSSDEGGAPALQPVVPVAPPAPEAGPPAPEVDAAPPKPAPKPTFPEVQSRGGPVIKSPRVVPITFTGDPLAEKIVEFTAKIATSSYWKTAGAEYGVGPIVPGDAITLAEPAPAMITSDQIETWLVQKLTGATPEFGAPDASTLYAIYYPAGTTIKMDGAGELGQSCDGYGGYHFEVSAGGVQVGYAVLPRCDGIDDLTVSASHEYFEWATDPFPKSKPAFAKLDDLHWAWQAAFIGELGDLCTFLDLDNLRPAEIGFVVQRQWSNQLSLAGKYPCAPVKTGPYLQAMPIALDDAEVPANGTFSKYIKTKAIRVPPGKKKTVDVLVYSDQPGAALVPLRAMSYAEFYGMGEPSGYSFELAKDYVEAGKTVELTVTAPAQVGSYDLVMMLSYTSDKSANYWPTLVVSDEAPAFGAPHPTIEPSIMRTRAGMRPFTKLGMKKAR